MAYKIFIIILYLLSIEFVFFAIPNKANVDSLHGTSHFSCKFWTRESGENPPRMCTSGYYSSHELRVYCPVSCGICKHNDGRELTSQNLRELTSQNLLDIDDSVSRITDNDSFFRNSDDDRESHNDHNDFLLKYIESLD